MRTQPRVRCLQALLKRERRVASQISARPGNSLDRRSKDRRQAQQRALQVELRQSSAVDTQLRRLDPPSANHGQRTHQPLDRCLHLKDGGTAPCGNQGRVAAKLDRVSKSLLCMEQHPAALQRLALPPGLAKDTWAAMHLAEAPARLV